MLKCCAHSLEGDKIIEPSLHSVKASEDTWRAITKKTVENSATNWARQRESCNFFLSQFVVFLNEKVPLIPLIDWSSVTRQMSHAVCLYQSVAFNLTDEKMKGKDWKIRASMIHRLNTPNDCCSWRNTISIYFIIFHKRTTIPRRVQTQLLIAHHD